MNDVQRPVNSHKAYHAHIYYNEQTKAFAKELCEACSEKFGLSIGRLHEKLVGPHPCWSCQISFGKKDFESFIPWLDENRRELTVFVHGVTGDDVKDHTDYAYWLGEPVELNLSFFDKYE